MARLELSLLGAFRVTLDGEPASFKTDKTRALLAYLAVEADQPHRRTSLAGLLWPDNLEARARHNLRQTLLYLRKAIGDGFLHIARPTLQFDLESDYLLDVARFTELIESSTTHEHADVTRCRTCVTRLEEAAALYDDEFLAQFFLDDSDAFEEWAQVTRESLRRKALFALATLTRYYTASNEHQVAQRYARRQTAIDPLREEAYRQVMLTLAAEGRRSEALAEYERLREVLADELGVEPAAETTTLYEQLSTGEWEQGSRGTAQITSPLLPISPAPLHNLPRQFSKFVGRESELDEIADLLSEPACALLTLVGPGGVGKTRLAIQAARDAAGQFRDGVWFVDLAPIASGDLLLTTIADALDLRFDSRLQTDAAREEKLLNYLQSREQLLVLDNLEHLLPAPDLIINILRSAPEVKLLVTSREPLALRAEWVLDIAGLPVPTADGGDTPAYEYDAVQLFRQSATHVQRDFALDNETIPTVAHICRRVAGVPLAIELAATGVRHVSLSTIAQRIDTSMDFLATTMADVPERHRSLRAVFNHSWDLLTAVERDVFARLAVFRGGFTADAAAHVAGATPDILTALTAKSLLRIVDDERYIIHEVLREYAGEHLDDAPSARSRHAEFYTAFVQQHENDIDVIRSEIDNVRAGWQWAISRPNLDALMRSATGLATYYERRYQFEEGEAAFRDAVDAMRRQEAEAPDVLAALLTEQARFLVRLARYEPAISAAREAVAQAQSPAGKAAGHLYWARACENKGTYEQAEAHYERTLSLASSEQHTRLEAEALFGLGSVCQKRTDYAGSRPYYERALQRFQELSDRQNEALTLHHLGHLHRAPSDHDTALRYYEQAMEIYRDIADRGGEGMILSSIGAILSEQGRFPESRAYNEQYLRLTRDIGDRREEGVALVNLGLDSICLGDFEAAGTYLEQSLRLRRHIGDQQGEGWSLMALGFLANQREEFTVAEEYCRQGYDLAHRLGDQQIQAHTLTHLGTSLLYQGRLSEAAEMFRRSRSLLRDVGWEPAALEPQAGLAAVALAQGDVAGAQVHIDDVVLHLEDEFPNSTFDPFRIYLICYRVLEDAGDPRADALRRRAGALLQERAEKIDNGELRRAFLEAVPSHRELLAV